MDGPAITGKLVLVEWLCLFPADQEVSQMLQELAYAASGRQQPAPTHVDLQQFLGLYLNHRPALQEPSDEVSQAFAALGADSATGMWVAPVLASSSVCQQCVVRTHAAVQALTVCTLQHCKCRAVL